MIWCPASNLALYGRTLDIEKIKGYTTILFGTDSNLSAPSNVWEHFREVRKQGMIDDAWLFHMLTRDAREFLYGHVSSGDWVIARKKHESRWDAFYNLDPEDILLVSIRDQIWLCDYTLAELRPPGAVRIQVGRSVKWIERNTANGAGYF